VKPVAPDKLAPVPLTRLTAPHKRLTPEVSNPAVDRPASGASPAQN
jgi:hypothetical protein